MTSEISAGPEAPAGDIAFIGGGNMARSLVGGLVAQGRDPATIRIAEPVPPVREALAADFGVAVFEQAGDAVQGAATWVFAVKPQVMRSVCEGLAPQAQAVKPLAISIAAGMSSGTAWIRAPPMLSNSR